MLILFSVYIICLSATACRNIQSVVLCEYNELYEYNGEYMGMTFGDVEIQAEIYSAGSSTLDAVQSLVCACEQTLHRLTTSSGVFRGAIVRPPTPLVRP